jgi:hypothetical protein
VEGVELIDCTFDRAADATTMLADAVAAMPLRHVTVRNPAFLAPADMERPQLHTTGAQTWQCSSLVSLHLAGSVAA